MINDYTCKICNREFTSLISLGVHISRTHQMHHQDYYDTYLKVEDEGYCLYCNKPTEYKKWGYKNYCNRSCQFKHNESKMLSTMEERYGTKYASQNSSSREKMETTCEERYGVKYGFHTDKGKQLAQIGHTEQSKQKKQESYNKTCKEKYGVEYYSQTDEWKEKFKNTCLEKYGVETILLLPEVFEKTHSKEAQIKREQTCREKYGVSCYFLTEDVMKHKNSSEARRKAKNTLRKNGKLSKYEEYVYSELEKLYIEYIPEYSSDLYPFNCDIYLPKYDLYIEINIHPMHNHHIFDSKNPKDLVELQKFKEKAKTSKWYQKVITIWTIQDVKKYQIAKQNRLNYIMLWSMEDIKKFLTILKYSIENT